jgi:hypothetical protein
MPTAGYQHWRGPSQTAGLRCELDEGKVVGRKSVISSCDAPTLLDFVEEPLDQVARRIQIWTEADRLFAIP